MEISVVEHCDTYNGGPMLSPPRPACSSPQAGRAACHEDRSPPHRGLILTGPHPTTPRSVRQLVESCPWAPSAGGTQCFGPLQHASTATAKGGCGQCARSRVDDHVRCVVSLAELCAVSLGEP